MVIAGCQRPSALSDTSSVIDIKAPILTKGKLQALEGIEGSLPAGKKACFGIDVKGAGIKTSAPTSCSSQLGVHTGFVEEGANLSLTVPMGESRVFRLLMLLVNTGAACPALGVPFLSAGSPFSAIYNAGQSGPIKVDSTSMEVIINFSYDSSNTPNIAAAEGLASCTSIPPTVHTPALRGVLYSSGQVRSASNIPFDDPNDLLSHPTLESAWKVDVGQAGAAGFGSVSAGGALTDLALGVSEVPKFLHSFTRKPDTNSIYGMDHSGQVYQVSGTTATALNSSACPFVSCEVPTWMQSLSAGKGTDLYALDHAGNIYALTSVGPSFTGQTVSPAVSQVIYY
jgi:hypothetical protein